MGVLQQCVGPTYEMFYISLHISSFTLMNVDLSVSNVNFANMLRIIILTFFSLVYFFFQSFCSLEYCLIIVRLMSENTG